MAQRELDEVVGKGWLSVLVEDNFRWRHILPAGFPHATTQDD